jgi:hypothetical protein
VGEGSEGEGELERDVERGEESEGGRGEERESPCFNLLAPEFGI